MFNVVKKVSNKVGALAAMLFVSAAVSFPALAGGTRIAEKQGSYWGTVVELFILAFNGILFLFSLVVLLMGGWFLVKDYVIAKSDHEKSFSIGKLVIAMIVASFLGYPSGAYLLGQDLTTGDVGGGKIEESDFKRPK